MFLEAIAISVTFLVVGAVYRYYRLESYKYEPPRHTRKCIKGLMEKECSKGISERPIEAERLEAIFS